MNWSTYRLLLRLRAPMHIGWHKIGNLQRTRPYVTGRALWGALTHRLGRDRYRQTNSPDVTIFEEVGEQVHATLATTYFYPALQINDTYQVQWPWEQPESFALRFLRSYASTALIYPQQAAAEGSLHEVEYLSPHTVERQTLPVYLWGYFFVAPDAPADWQNALSHLQFGGERGYGWGAVELVDVAPVAVGETLFDLPGMSLATVDSQQPQIRLEAGLPLLAHTLPAGLSVRGQLEPLLGREQPRQQLGHAGQHVVFEAVCFAPGSESAAAAVITVGRHGIWQAAAT